MAAWSSKGEFITLDGSTGACVPAAKCALDDARAPGRVSDTDELGRRDLRRLKVRTNADTPARRRKARRDGRRGHRPLPHRAHVFQDFEQPERSTDRQLAIQEMIVADSREAAAESSGQAAAVPAARLHRHLQGHGRLPGHHPPDRPAAARVRAARPPKSRPSWRPRSAWTWHDRRTPCRAAPRSQPHARPPRLPPVHHLPRDPGHAGPRHHRSGHRVQEGRNQSIPRDHDPADASTRKSCRFSTKQHAESPTRSSANQK